MSEDHFDARLAVIEATMKNIENQVKAIFSLVGKEKDSTTIVKVDMSAVKTQVRIQWWLIALIVVAILGIAFMIYKKAL